MFFERPSTRTNAPTSNAPPRDDRAPSPLRSMSFDDAMRSLSPDAAPVQRHGAGNGAADVHAAAARGTSGAGSALPYASTLQAAFGGHDLSGVRAFVGGPAADASRAMGADAYATGNRVAFSQAPSLHTAAHEAAHVVQQRAGVSLAGGVGKAGDSYERQADQVADAVVAGKSAEGLLGKPSGGGGGGAVQHKLSITSQRLEEDGGQSRGRINGKFTALREAVARYEKLERSGAKKAKLIATLESDVLRRALAYEKNYAKKGDDTDHKDDDRHRVVELLVLAIHRELKELRGEALGYGECKNPQAPSTEVSEQKAKEIRDQNERHDQALSDIRLKRQRREEPEEWQDDVVVQMTPEAFERWVERTLRRNPVHPETPFQRNPIASMPVPKKGEGSKEPLDEKPQGSEILTDEHTTTPLAPFKGAQNINKVYKGGYVVDGKERTGFTKFFDESKDHLSGSVHVSRLAGQLGRQDLVGESRYVKHAGKGNEAPREGVVSLGVEGEMLRSVLGDLDLRDPSIQKQLNDLNWFDKLIGQSDRHTQNMIFDKKTNKLTGIDDDRVFTAKNSATPEGLHMNPEHPEQGHHTGLPNIIHKDMYDKLMALTPSALLRAIQRRETDPVGTKGMAGDWNPTQEFAGFVRLEHVDDPTHPQMRSVNQIVVSRLELIQQHLKTLNEKGMVVTKFDDQTYEQSVGQEIQTLGYHTVFAGKLKPKQRQISPSYLKRTVNDQLLELLRQGFALVDQKKYPEAIEVFDRMLRIDPSRRAEVLPNRATCYRLLGNTESAIADYLELGQLCSVESDKQRSYIFAGTLFRDAGRKAEAVECFVKAYRITPSEEVVELLGTVGVDAKTLDEKPLDKSQKDIVNN